MLNIRWGFIMRTFQRVQLCRAACRAAAACNIMVGICSRPHEWLSRVTMFIERLRVKLVFGWGVVGWLGRCG